MKLVNDKAKFNYELGERIEAGIVLIGPEVKSAKLGQVDMSNAHVRTQNSKFKGQSELWVVGMQIFPYKHADNTKYDPQRSRKLLLSQKEILAILNQMKQSRRMLVPTAMYTKEGLIKLEIAMARGKKKYEKRESIKKRDAERESRRV
ncbi:MAG: SsrA-binding protein [Candidatus Gottesmanbacteria bacterium GW2011_GWA1_48_13]|uniref:SsrA-binding protein n=1 Tax=Candidatus Gottesmanbacteria bacterium GW2011_GWA1_48_13 TaxID=1618439 RepID=A0A0G1XLT9_9BACT|nr:MAG: SsrA-binding protein [Candidatus Gottesmanbacteria bacterium GW2011_GWA1_48_13]